MLCFDDVGQEWDARLVAQKMLHSSVKNTDPRSESTLQSVSTRDRGWAVSLASKSVPHWIGMHTVILAYTT